MTQAGSKRKREGLAAGPEGEALSRHNTSGAAVSVTIQGISLFYACSWQRSPTLMRRTNLKLFLISMKSRTSMQNLKGDLPLPFRISTSTCDQAHRNLEDLVRSKCRIASCRVSSSFLRYLMGTSSLSQHPRHKHTTRD